MSSRLKAILQFSLILLITFFLVWLSLKSIVPPQGERKWDYLVNIWGLADKFWLVAMAVVAIASHLIRALRWRMLLQSSGHSSRLSNGFLSLMVGYLVNLAIPRGGELSRCYNLYKLERLPVDVTFGTVVVERVIDLLCLLLLLIVAFLMEANKLVGFISSLPIDPANFFEGRSTILFIITAAVILIGVVAPVLWRNHKVRSVIQKTWSGILHGIRSVMELRNVGTFMLYSALIWILYFLMSYTVIMAFQSTAHLGVRAVLSLFAIGSIAMALPLPGGTGSYHVLVPQGLIFLYSIQPSEAVAFTFIFHGWQTFIMIVAGATAFLITTFRTRKNGT